ncbi:MAG: hypothetical protein UV73_C0007G0011 [Candidatus Gottesmanbacteria bacterium GW2011_GWA2_43_14]|uniref:Cohesin domain-containing protein n=1 Tax=Candidatus Gottesmanbacteria bacterium GW2011_GWA2_43_14 TaxID=1618443 RepID=A0A0G1GFC8_9BACT|nr:MAG: hypothetical protein UV73_C0007G0011 [Candidatus Gottesmanbacteria bacterium GW2011_GWA2_43_14]
MKKKNRNIRHKKNNRRIYYLTAAVAVFIFLAAIRLILPIGVKIKIETPAKIVKTQSTFPMSISFESRKPIQEIDLWLAYDPKYLDVEKVDPSPSLWGDVKTERIRGLFHLTALAAEKNPAVTIRFITKKNTGPTIISLDSKQSRLMSQGKNLISGNHEIKIDISP